MKLKPIIDQLKKDSLEALKQRDTEKREVLNTILSDLKVDGKDPDDSVGLDKAFSVLKGYKKAQEKGGNMGAYIQVLDSLLPKQMTLGELEKIVSEKGLTNMGEAMKWFKLPENKHYLFEPATLKQLFN